MPRSPVTEMLERFNALNEVEQAVFLDLVDPWPEPEAPAKVKRTRKKKADAPVQKRGLPVSTNSDALCTAQVPGLNVVCGNKQDNGIHDPQGGYGGYHPFESSAPAAAKKSSRRTASTKASQLPIQNSETLTDSAGSAVQESQKIAS